MALCALGFAVGVFGTLVGAGGGFILTPVLLLLYPHSTPDLTTAISLVVVFFNASSGTVAYARQRRVDYRSGLLFAACTLPGAVLAATITHLLAGSFHHALGLRRAAALSVGVIAGAQLGAHLSQRLSGRRIQHLLAAGLLALGTRLVLSVLL